MSFIPPHIAPHGRPLSMWQSLQAARRNVLEIIPAIAYVQPMLSGRMGTRWHMVQDPVALKRIFLDNVAAYPKSEVMNRMLRPAVGNSLFTAQGAEWRWQRRAVAPVFAQRNIAALAPMMTATAERAASRLAATPGPHEMVREMLSATFDVICEVALSGREHFDSEVYGAAITRYFQTVGKASLLDFLQVPSWVPRPGAVLGADSVRTMHRMVADAIEARRAHVTEGAGDLLDRMLAAEDPETGRRMTPEELLHNMQFFIVAGHETTAIALGWALYLLAGTPEFQDRARTEAQAVLDGRPASAEDREAMPYIGQVLEEAMRLYPPVGFLARDAIEHDLLSGREIRPGDTVFLAIYALHRHEMWWDRPNEFDPDNFTPERAKDRHRFLYLPFGAGPRICVGANFAMMQAEIILATLLSRFRFKLTDMAPPVPTMSMTVRPEGGVWLKTSALAG